jgi:hypothetical protein
MHRDNGRYQSEPSRGLSSKQFVSDLRDQGMPCEAAVEAVRQAFGVPRGAAQLFVLSHPAWAEYDERPWEC